MPNANRSGIPSHGRIVRPKYRADKEHVSRSVAHHALCLGELKSPSLWRNERFGLQIEFPHDHCICSATRQLHHRPIRASRPIIQQAVPSPYPSGAFGSTKRIQAEQHFPGRLWLGEFFEGGPSPHSMRIESIGPKVIEKFSDLCDLRQLSQRILVHVSGFCLQQAAVQRGPARVPEGLQSGFVLCLHPGRCAGRFQIFKPTMRVIRRRSLRHRQG
mmetsp:Transcript_32561/g.107375  ORF Transcript_32561/g.107375 Transcript_32561/m.107375 type:complete len:216 (-) Transcript_32561:387-1034(-)